MRQGGSYFVTRNDSSIIAFKLGEDLVYPHFQVAASHSDSPTYRIKTNPELKGPGSYVRLNVEGYGGLIDRTWLDRPLSVAGRVVVAEGGRIHSRLFAPDEDLFVIPSLAVHMDRTVNEHGALNRQVDLCPLVSGGLLGQGAFQQFLADRLEVNTEQIFAHDLVLVNRQKPVVWGLGQEFISAPRLDDLQCAFASLRAFMDVSNRESVMVYACFDNEEVGSGTMQGALSTFFSDTLERVCLSLGVDRRGYARAIAGSFLVSCDNAQAVHPNHPELYDEANRAWINQGVVIKESASQRYTTSAPARALFEHACRKAGVPTQSFANRSDMAGGSTLGNLLMRQVSMRSVDVGLPQLAMHSAYETAGTCDTAYLMQALRSFYTMDCMVDANGSVVL